MATDESGRGMTTVERDGSGLRITVFATLEMGSILLLSVWLAFWVVGEVAGFRHLLGDGENKLGLILWLALWTLGGLVAACVLLWQLTGKEIIELNATRLRRRKQILLFGTEKEFAVAAISNMRLAPPQPKRIRGKYVVSSPLTRTGAIAFDVGRDTHHVGQGLDETEARFVLEELCKQVKSLRAQDNEAPSQGPGSS